MSRKMLLSSMIGCMLVGFALWRWSELGELLRKIRRKYNDKQMTYFERIQDLKRNFTAEYLDRETCLMLFEDLLHEYGLLPIEEHIDRTISKEHFSALLELALEHKNPVSNRDPQISRETQQSAFLVSIRPKSCPICKVKAIGIYNQIITGDQQVFRVNPPRCKACMMLWVEEHFGQNINGQNDEPFSVSIDTSAVSPLKENEMEFFKLYESQMR